MPRCTFRSRAYQFATRTGIARYDRVGRNAFGQFPHGALRIDRILARFMRALFERFPPVFGPAFDLLAPCAVLLLFEQRQQRAQGLGAIAHEIDFHRITQAQHVGLEVDLDAARRAFLRQEFRVGKARADHQQRVALGHHVVTRFGAEQADRARHPRQIVGQHGFAEQRLGDARTELFGDGDDFVGRVQRAGADQDRHFLAGVQHVGGLLQIVGIGHETWRAITHAGMQRAVFAAGRFIGQILQVVGQDDRRDLAFGERDAHRAVDQMAHLRGHRGLLDEGAGDVLEHRNEIEFLLIVAAQRGARLLSGDGEHRHVVHARVVQAGDQMRSAGTRSRDANAEFAGEFRMRRRHERGHFFVADLDEFDRTGLLPGFASSSSPCL